MAAPGDDARGHVEKALAAEIGRQRFAAVDTAAMEIAAALCEQAQSLDAGGGLEVELDGGESLVEARDGVRKDCLPGRVGGHAEAPGAPGAGGVGPALRGLDLAQDALCGLDEGGAERGEAHPLGRALEEPGAELALEPCDDAGQGGLGHREPVGRQSDLSRLGDAEESDEIGSLVEHCAVAFGAGRPAVSLLLHVGGRPVN